MKQLLAFILIIGSLILNAQQYDPLHKPNSYQSSTNPNYWKNKMPHQGYWQQDVYYDIKANIDEKSDIISGKETLVYTNNSPDELNFVYFHLYQNAFQPDSYNDHLQKINNTNPKYGEYEAQKLGTVVSKMQSNGTDLKMELDNTILKVYLDKPLRSGASITFDIEFKTYFDKGGVRRRMKTYPAYGNKHYNGVHWYPRISVYDRKFGWTTDQHLGKEFYGDFGAFDVELTFASNFIVEATGYLLNREEVLPEELYEKIKLENFKDKPWNTAPTVILPYDSTKRKTWKYHAENVHDFAFTADPTYRIGRAEWNGITCVAVVQEPHAGKWQNAASFAADVIKTYSEDIGMYTYHKMVVADAQDGMEYPMLTLDGGMDPSYRGLLAHEIGHNWFFGQVGNNETYRAALDEGFTQFLTAWALESIDGDTLVLDPPKNGYKRRFTKPTLARDARVYLAYLQDANTGEGAYLNTHSDQFGNALGHGGGYRQVYYKTATMLYNLQYVLGDELFLAAMQNYFNEWKIAHPYFNDFRNSIITYTKVDLNWFFDQWIETNKTIDYAYKGAKKVGNDEYVVKFKRIGEMQMPIDFEVVSKDDKVYNFHIPNNWFIKKTEAQVLPKWTGWGKLNTEYETKIVVPGGIKYVHIDHSNRLADVNMLNNSSSTPVKLTFDSRVDNKPDWKNYEMYGRPDVWYNDYDGLKLGLHVNGDYMDKFHVFDANVWFNSGLLQKEYPEIQNQFDNISFRLNYKTSTHKFMKGSNVFSTIKSLDGLNSYLFGIEKFSNNKKYRLYSFFKSMIRYDKTDLNYLLYADLWDVNKLNNTLTFGIDKNYHYVKGIGKLNLNLRSASILSDYDYAQLSFNAVNKNKLGKFNFNSRVYAQYGTGSKTPKESALYLAGANPEQLMENKYTRAQGFVPSEWTGDYSSGTNNFQMGGGLNLRGYAGYLAPEEGGSDTLVYTYMGNSGAAVNLELDFNRLVKFNPKFLKNMFKIETYLFADAGVIDYTNAAKEWSISDIRADAGVGSTFTIQKWGPLDNVKPLTIRFDMPLVLNRPPAIDEDYFQVRWVVGINRAF